MEPPAFWRDLEALFRALADPRDSLAAMDREDGTWTLSGGPENATARASLQNQFIALAIRGAVAAGLSDGTAPSPLDAWLNRLKNGPYFEPCETQGESDDGLLTLEGGWINRLATASAECCVTLETEAF